MQLFDDTDEELVDEFYGEARDRGVPLVPTLTDGTAPGVMAAILADPASRATHVDAIARFAADHGAEGIDINYENFAFEDGKDTWQTTRPNWVAFVRELGERLHADGRILTVSVPPVYDDERTDDSGYWVYDYGAHRPARRRHPHHGLRLLDRSSRARSHRSTGSTRSSTAPPTPPAVRRSWCSASRCTGATGSSPTTGECPPSAAPRSRTRGSARSPDLIDRRDADPVYDAETGEWSFTYQVTYEEGEQSCTQSREVHYVDAAGARERMQRSIDAGFLGVALFAFGYDDDGVWTNIEEINATLPTTTSPPDGGATTSAAPTTRTTARRPRRAATSTAPTTTSA